MADQMTTQQIEMLYSLADRTKAVMTAVHAMDHIRKVETDFLARLNALELLRDGVANALDGRSTGGEWRNVRWKYKIERDGSQPQIPADRRCQACGFPDPVPFQHCHQHLHGVAAMNREEK